MSLVLTQPLYQPSPRRRITLPQCTSLACPLWPLWQALTLRRQPLSHTSRRRSAPRMPNSGKLSNHCGLLERPTTRRSKAQVEVDKIEREEEEISYQLTHYEQMAQLSQVGDWWGDKYKGAGSRGGRGVGGKPGPGSWHPAVHPRSPVVRSIRV